MKSKQRATPSPTLYETGQRVRYDAREHLRFLARLPEFQMARNPPSEIDQRRELPARVSSGWHYLPDGTPNRDREVERPIQSARHKIAGVLPCTMRPLAEILTLLGPDRLAEFCERVEIAGSHPLLEPDRVARLQSAITRRLSGVPRQSDRKTISRLLKHIEPTACRPPIDVLSPLLAVGAPVAVSASALYLDGRVVAIPSAPGWPVVGKLGPYGLVLDEPPAPKARIDPRLLSGLG